MKDNRRCYRRGFVLPIAESSNGVIQKRRDTPMNIIPSLLRHHPVRSSARPPARPCF